MHELDALFLPPRFEPVIDWRSFEVGSDTRVRYASLSPHDWPALLRALRRSAGTLRVRPVREAVRSIGRVAERLLDSEDRARTEALHWLVRTADMSAEMAAAVLTGMARDWTSDRLMEMLEREFEDPEVLDGFRRLDSGRAVHALGPRLSFQVGAGSVPGVSVSSVIRALLVKSAVLLKPGRADVALPVLFARALANEDPELASSLCVAYWPGGESPAEDLAMEAADVIVAFGGNESLAALRRRAPITSRFIAYHHRVSLGLVGRDALGSDGGIGAAASAAAAVSMFDQRGCVSPHVLYVERGGDLDPAAWAAVLAEAMAAVELRLPQGGLTAGEASAVHQRRGAAELAAASGSGTRLHRAERGFWTVIYEEDPSFVLSCHNRVVYVKPVGDLAEVPEWLEGLERHLQTAALMGAGPRREELGLALARVGVTRITSFDDSPWPPPWWHHDGGSAFEGLVRWVDLEHA